MLYLAREDEPERHRGAVVRLRDTVFAPPEEALRFVRLDAPDVDVDAFRVAYLSHLRARWRDDPVVFLGHEGGDRREREEVAEAETLIPLGRARARPRRGASSRQRTLGGGRVRAMTVTTKQLDHGRVVTVACDDGRSDRCRHTKDWQTRYKATGGDARAAVSFAVGQGWQHVRRGGKPVDVCPECVEAAKSP